MTEQQLVIGDLVEPNEYSKKSGLKFRNPHLPWTVEVAYNHPYGENSTKIHLVLVNNTVVKIQD
jgi:hypothetical protein